MTEYRVKVFVFVNAQNETDAECVTEDVLQLVKGNVGTVTAVVVRRGSAKAIPKKETGK